MAVSFRVRTTRDIELVNIDHKVQQALGELDAVNGVVTVFSPHTTGGITINENADPDVCQDWVENMRRLVPADQGYYRHAEGNSHSHVLCSLVGVSEQVIVQGGRMVLGTWQSLYFAEFDGARNRTVYVEFTPSQK